MAEIEHLSIALPAPVANSVRRAVEAGEYATASEVIREERDLDVLRQKWDEGKASGRAGTLDIRRLIVEERAKLEGRFQIDAQPRRAI